MAISTRPSTSLASTPTLIAAIFGGATLLGCATGAEDLDTSSTFASVDSGDDEVETDEDESDTDTTEGDGEGESETTSESDTDTTEDTAPTDTTTEESESADDMPDPCGNTAIELGEECDGVNLGGNTCVSLGFDGGSLGCAADCTLDTSACETIEEFCGDGIINLAEDCDGAQLGNATCASAGFVFGTIACNPATCQLDTSACQNAWTEDFEDGVVPAGWTGGGTAPWVVTNADKHAGSWAAKAGLISHSQESWGQVVVQFPIAGSVSFWHRISSESSYDYGEFYVDGVLQSDWSGSGTWQQYNTAVGAGQHTFRWRYVKDASVNSNQDTWYVDDVVFTGGYVP